MTGPKNVEDLIPLSPMQRLMLLHALTAAEGTTLHNQVCYEIDGPFDHDAFHAAWERLVQRHAALRTVFLWKGLKEPLQVVRTRVSLPFRTIDVSDGEEAAPLDRFEALRRADAAEPFVLGKAPLMRGTLVRMADDRHRFIWCIHHLVVDRWSHGILLSELGRLYESSRRGEESGLPPARAFREYIEWLGARDTAAAESFWRSELRGVRPTLLAGAVRDRQAGRRMSRRVVSAATSKRIRETAARWRASAGAALLGAIGIAASRIVRRDDVLLGLTVAGRPPDLDGAETIVGSFVNNIPLRLRLERDRPVSEWVRSLHRAQALRQPFEHESLRDLREWSAIPSPQPLFDTLILLNLEETADARLGDAMLRPIGASLDAAYPFLLALGSDGDELVLSLVHDAAHEGAEALLDEVAAAIASLAAAEEGTTVGELLLPLDDATQDGQSRSERADEGSGAPALSAAAHRAPGTRVAGANGAGPVSAEAMLALWREVLGTTDLGLDDDFFGAGGSSMQALELLVRMERLLGRPVPIAVLFEGGTVRDTVAAAGAPAVSRPLVVRQSGAARPPLVAVPGVGGNVVSLASLSRALGPEQPFHALHSPGLDGREPPLSSIEAVAERFLEQMATAMDRPFYLLGFCWGAAVAFEMARQLEARGRPALSLGLVDPATLLREESSGSGSAEAEFIGRRLDGYRAEWRRRGWRARGSWLVEKARRAASAFGAAERAERRMEYHRFRVMRANREAILRYDPAVFRGPATIFITADRVLPAGSDPRFEWQRLIDPPPPIVSLPGIDSGDALSPANVARLATALRDWMDASRHVTATS